MRVLIEVARTQDIPEGEARRFSLPSGRALHGPVMVANLGAGRFVALGDTCSHAEASLSEGEVDVDDVTIECPRHGSVFDLATGAPRSLPATVPVPAFPVKVEGDTILIEIDD